MDSRTLPRVGGTEPLLPGLSHTTWEAQTVSVSPSHRSCPSSLCIFFLFYGCPVPTYQNLRGAWFQGSCTCHGCQNEKQILQFVVSHGHPSPPAPPVPFLNGRGGTMSHMCCVQTCTRMHTHAHTRDSHAWPHPGPLRPIHTRD